MAFNFDSEQFNKETLPRRMGNWEVPRWAPTRARPLEYRPNPKPLCDANGHFLPGAPRGTSKCFGHYVGTWDLPRKITRKVAEELAKEPPEGRFLDWLNPRVQRPKHTSANVRRKKGKKDEKPPTKPDTSEFKDSSQIEDHKDETEYTNRGNDHDNVINDEAVNNKADDPDKNDDPFEWNKVKKPVDADGHGPYVPGSLTDPDKRHESYDLLVDKAVEDVHGPQEDVEENFWRKVAENAKGNAQEDMKHKKNNTPKLPAVNVTQNFQFAKRMHVGNLEHQPLPDTLGYRKLTKIAEHRDSDIVVKPYAIGWKGYGASGPTCCTKMRVHRPKTCDPKKAEVEGDNKQRPSTSAPNLGGQYTKRMSLMDLAICWDFRPDDNRREPKPPKHIDGSNGSRAPAVFTMVHTPKEVAEEPVRAGLSNPIFNQNRIENDVGHHAVPYFEKDMSREKRKDSCDVQYCPQHTYNNERAKPSNNNNSRRSSANFASKPQCDGIHGCGTPSESSRKSSRDLNSRPDKLQPIKQAWNDKQVEMPNPNRARNSLESYEKTPLAQGKLHQSSPNESQVSRRSPKESESTNNNSGKHKTCISCNRAKICYEPKRKEDYKFAFKAGNPNSVQSATNSSADTKEVKVPKMRHPYAKKSYTIPTLAPPFTIWKDANATGYPEHWRLASVYQHAYKPLEQRRKPLIASVYQ